jgi:hypothetical protein
MFCASAILGDCRVDGADGTARLQEGVGNVASMIQRPRLRDMWLSVFRYLLLVGALSLAGAPRAAADELEALHRQILRQPNNAELNLRFARVAEASGHLRWALAAYERVVINDPGNLAAQSGLQRARRALQPDVTLMTLQLGGRYESNPRYYLPPRRAEAQALGSAALLVERAFNGLRWRTNAFAAGLAHQRESELNYGIAGADTGPVVDILPGWSMHPAIGGRAAYYDHRYYYSEGALSATFDSTLYGIYRSVQLRGAYRSYADFFPSSEGFYVEARGRVAIPNALGPGSVAILSPWVVWSDIAGNASVVTPIVTELQPGAYLEWGGKAEALRSVTNWLVVGLSIAASVRDYRTDIVVSTGDKREDTIVIPGASFTFPNLFASRHDLRLEYQYIRDRSNDPTKTFEDHIATASIVARFDPTLPWRGAAVTNAQR